MDANVKAFGPTTWLGSLLYNKTDGSGLLYMRNRYYDPQTGQFTQEDPIGLAGGLNLYGFANGDPINFSDPFGLLPDTIQVQVVRTGPKEYHTSIRVAPDDGSPAFTLGAGPASKVLAVLGLPTSLVSDRNRAGDTGRQAWSITIDPGAQGEAAAIRRLKALDAGYCDCLPYELKPEANDPNYNSNGYHQSPA